MFMTWADRVKIEERLEGRKEGRQEGAQEVVLRQIIRRFGAAPEGLRQRIASMDLDELIGLGERVVQVGSLRELTAK